MHDRTNSYRRTVRYGNAQIFGPALLTQKNVFGELVSDKLVGKDFQGISSAVILGVMVLLMV